ncbi:MAG: Lysine exporter protein (LYSE/YGGA) [Rhodobacteraceae bacterium]|uniref:LysE/ArgO family amino acid transporter n=1 Tax=Cypionkella sp. TaxID=2811411 RepID=UPI0013280E4E|nr:LysE/ArgO family amino acid transporter [Cypionkella sp.]KAF0170121.1 MAG: Lysine exporter protein (LYSE/YGGA) [Paracoccaceae bacterium]MDO8326318.1 LysE/ArgO family amino acid transporter [Cypionkella sp.]
MIEAAVQGYLVAVSLIMAIGAQNAFVLRQGLRREHVGAVVLACAASDAVLIAAGVTGFGFVSAKVPWIGEAMRWGGVIFLLVYGALRFKAALAGGEALRPGEGAAASLSKVLTTCLVLTWANPHVYLDTVVLLGSISAQYPGHRLAFGVAAACGSFSFFAALGYGARLLAPVFAKPAAWVVLEIVVGATMWAIAAGLAFGG